jgi:integrase
MATPTLSPEDRDRLDTRIAALEAELAELRAQRRRGTAGTVRHRMLNRLSEQGIKKLRARKLHPDGGNLYLSLRAWPSRHWVFRFAFAGHQHELGLGGYPAVSLREARDGRDEARRLLRQGINPVAQRAAERAAKRVETAKPAMTFRQCAEAFVAAHSAAWSSTKHRDQVEASLAQYAYPVLGDLPVSAIDTGLVLKIVEPMWQDTTETASRVRSRIERVLDWARTRGYRDGENPARWRGHLQTLLPSRAKAQPVQHHAAMKYDAVPGFVANLQAQSSIQARALEFTILTASRLGESLGAVWGEFDLDARVWTIPAERMKGKREHRVPLSDAAMAIIEQMQQLPRGDLVFPCSRTTVFRLSSAASVTSHGFRSSFRDWVAERTSFPSEVAELALAHKVGSAVEQAYRRSDQFERRRKLAAAWAEFCCTPVPAGTVVVPLKRQA